jgi:hypothetical protein
MFMLGGVIASSGGFFLLGRETNSSHENVKIIMKSPIWKLL